MKLEDYLRDNAKLYPNKLALVCGEQRMSYRQLWNAVVYRTSQHLYEKGQLIPFRAICSVDTLVEYFSIHLAGGIALPLDKQMNDEKFEDYIHLAANHCLTEVSLPYIGNAADVLFTTGTTGKSKGVIISHDTIVANGENLIESQGYHHDMTFIITGPLNHIGSLSKIFPTIMVGGTLRIIDGMKNINSFFSAIEESKEHVATFLVPTSIRMILTFAADRLAQCQNLIEMIETGAAPISKTDMEHLCQLLPHTRLYNTYASTETGIIATYDFNADECLSGCLGSNMRHSELFITKDGHVACKGKTLMMGYLGDISLTRSVLRDGVLYTADIGRIDEKGRLRLLGRTGDVFNIGGYKVMPTEVEEAALSIHIIKDCVCTMIQHRVLGNVLKLLVVLHGNNQLDKRTLAKALQAKLESYKVPMQYEQVDNIQRTFNGKIDRKYYL